MTRIIEGIYSDEGEIDRWAVKRHSGDEAAEVRLSRWEPYPGTTHLVIFVEGDPPGTPRIAVNLDAEHVEELIGDLQELLPKLRGE